MKNSCPRYIVLCCCLFSACATVPPPPTDGPPLDSLYEDDQSKVQLTAINQLVDAHSTCELRFTFANKSQVESGANFEVSVVTQNGYTLDQGALAFQSVAPGQSDNGVKYVYSVGCPNIMSVHLSKIN
jgi:hypothetical protein